MWTSKNATNKLNNVYIPAEICTNLLTFLLLLFKHQFFSYSANSLKWYLYIFYATMNIHILNIFLNIILLFKCFKVSFSVALSNMGMPL